MNDPRARRPYAIEAAAAGLAYSAGLCWISASMVASFRPANLSLPYWSAVPALRTDTCGIAAFVTVGACLPVSEYLRLRRRQAAPRSPGGQPSAEPATLFAAAAARTVAILATGVVLYVSVNSVTHPLSLMVRATHLASWPTEGTLRVGALGLCTFSVAVLRYLRAQGLAVVGPGLQRDRLRA